MHNAAHYFSCLALAALVTGQALVSTQAIGQAAAADTPEQEAENVARLHRMLESYHSDQPVTAPADSGPAPAAAVSPEPPAIISDDVLLRGSAGSNALAEITQRLADPAIAESQRDTALICLVRTHLFDTLVGRENRSLKPVGKHHFAGTARLQPGTTTLGIQSRLWQVQLPPETPAKDYLITLYSPDNAAPELHVIAVEDLLAAGQPPIPAWIPPDLEIRTVGK